MSIQSEIDRITENVLNAYSAVEEMGGTLPDEQNSLNLAESVMSIPKGGGIVGDVPIGTIVFWSGSSDEVPTGWHICDGTDGTVDLRDKFILAAGTKHAVGSTGGNETVTLTEAQMPKHKHSVSRQLNSSNYTSATLTSGDYRAIDPSGAYAINSTETGSSQPHQNMPPYYALCAIQKISSGSSLGGVSMDEVDNAIDNKLGDIASILDAINGGNT